MDMKEKWNGSKILRQDFKPNVYARRDKDGNQVELDRRAESMAACLEEVHWGEGAAAKEGSSEGSANTEARGGIRTEVHALVLDHLSLCKKEAVVNIELDRPFEGKELEECIRRAKRNKAAGTDNITADWLKDLDRRNRAKLLAMINDYGRKRNGLAKWKRQE